MILLIVSKTVRLFILYAVQFFNVSLAISVFMSSWLSFIFGNKKKTDRRKDLRHPVQFEARLNSESVSNAKARVTNIGLKGCYIEMVIAVERGEKMQVNISLPTGKIFTVDGIVTFCDPKIGFGVEYLLTRSQKEFMQDLIEYVRQDAKD
jgi:hypothetical protein